MLAKCSGNVGSHSFEIDDTEFAVKREGPRASHASDYIEMILNVLKRAIIGQLA